MKTLCSRTDLPKLKLNDLELAWVAGLLEGEGTFTPVRNRRKLKKSGIIRRDSQPRTQFQTQDRDVAKRFANLLGSNLLGPYSNNRSQKGFGNGKCKPCWVVSMAGKKSAALNISIYPMMGVRRKRQIRSALKEWGTI